MGEGRAREGYTGFYFTARYIRNVFCMRRLTSGIRYFPIFVAHAFYTSIYEGPRSYDGELTSVLHETGSEG